MKKRMISLILVLVMCFCLLSFAASAAKLNDAAEKLGGIFSTIKAFDNVFGLPPVFSSLFDLFKGNKLQNALAQVIGILEIFVK